MFLTGIQPRTQVASVSRTLRGRMTHMKCHKADFPPWLLFYHRSGSQMCIVYIFPDDVGSNGFFHNKHYKHNFFKKNLSLAPTLTSSPRCNSFQLQQAFSLYSQICSPRTNYRYVAYDELIEYLFPSLTFTQIFLVNTWPFLAAIATGTNQCRIDCVQTSVKEWTFY